MRPVTSSQPAVKARRRLPKGAVIVLFAVEMLALGALGFLLLVLLIPDWFGIETFCLFDGPQAPAADALAVAAIVALISTGIGILTYAIALIDHRRPWWWLIPPAWLATLVAVEAVAAPIIGPQPCQGGFF